MAPGTGWPCATPIVRWASAHPPNPTWTWSLTLTSDPTFTLTPTQVPGLRAVWTLFFNNLSLALCPHLLSRAEKETKAKVAKITEIRDLTIQIRNIKR